MIALLGLTLALAPSVEFGRAKPALGGAKASAQDIVNVIGRWRSYRDWESVGLLPEIDKLFDAQGDPLEKLPAIAPAELAPGGQKALLKRDQVVASTPQRRGFCLKNGLVQRYWLQTNVPLLPFTSEALAASVGSSVEEMNARPVSSLACDVVFDALSLSQSGIISRELCDERRAACEAADGSFDTDAFAAQLAQARLVIARSYAIYPGSLWAVQLVVFLQIDGPRLVAEYLEGLVAKMGRNTDMWSQMLGLADGPHSLP